ncbi:hypothetical protein AB0230_07150 [Microbacterium sp. NPDC089190]|uniref:hypothetical protein n=1 Tax=Microbacterium sp. NPDC089190 TaxID=3155063 RepID=UPI00344E7330
MASALKQLLRAAVSGVRLRVELYRLRCRHCSALMPTAEQRFCNPRCAAEWERECEADYFAIR